MSLVKDCTSSVGVWVCVRYVARERWRTGAQDRRWKYPVGLLDVNLTGAEGT